MLPKRTPLDIVDELDSGEVHIAVLIVRHGNFVRDFGGGGGGPDRAFGGCGLGWGDGRAELRAAEDVGDEAVVVEAPDAVGAGGFQGVGLYEAADEGEVAMEC